MQESREMVRIGVCRIGKAVMILVAVAAVFGLSGCSLIPMWNNGVIYFYSMVEGDWSDTNDYTLEYVNNGEYTIIMSRGIGGKRLTKEQAIELKENHTEFELSVDGDPVSQDSVRDVDKLGIFGLSGWHVVQEFSIGPLEKDNEYTLIGITRFPDSPNEFDKRENTVNVTVQ